MTVPMVNSPEEQLWQERINGIGGKIENLARTVELQLSSVSRVVEEGNRSIQRILDDHEARLREQNKTDGMQAQEIAALRVQVSDLKGEVGALSVKMDTVVKNQDERRERELHGWRNWGFELLKYVLLGGSAGGIVYGAAKMVGRF